MNHASATHSPPSTNAATTARTVFLIACITIMPGPGSSPGQALVPRIHAPGTQRPGARLIQANIAKMWMAGTSPTKCPGAAMTRLISSGVGTRDGERRPIGIAVGERDQLLIIGLGGADSLLASLQHQPRPNP